MYIQETSCCGMRELDGIRDAINRYGPNGVIERILRDGARNGFCGSLFYDADLPSARFIIFTQAVNPKDKGGYGFTLRNYIHKEKLGVVTVSRPGINPNSGNKVTVFTWRMSDSGLRRWARKQGLSIPSERED